MWWILKAFHKSRGSRALSTHGGNLMFYLKTWKSPKWRVDVSPPTMMKCREIIAGTGLAGAAPAAASVKKAECFSFHIQIQPAQAGESAYSLWHACLSNYSWNESLRRSHLLTGLSCLCFCPVGTSVMQVTATDADDPTYGNSARLVYSILQGQPYFSVEPQTGEAENRPNTATTNRPRCSATQRQVWFLRAGSAWHGRDLHFHYNRAFIPDKFFTTKNLPVFSYSNTFILKQDNQEMFGITVVTQQISESTNRNTDMQTWAEWVSQLVWEDNRNSSRVAWGRKTALQHTRRGSSRRRPDSSEGPSQAWLGNANLCGTAWLKSLKHAAKQPHFGEHILILAWSICYTCPNTLILYPSLS